MNNRANANPQDLKQFAKDLQRFEDQVKQEIKALRNRYQRLDWSDRERQRFDADFNQLCKGIDASMRSNPEMQKLLNRKASDLERYLGR